MEEAKLIFELVNRSGVQGGGGSTAPGGQSGGKSAPTTTEKFNESTAGGVREALDGNNPQKTSQPAATVPASPAAPVSQPIAPPTGQSAVPAENDTAKQIKEIVNAIKPATNQIPVLGGLVGKAAGFADIAAKIGPLFAPKVQQTQAEMRNEMRRVEAETAANIPQFSQPSKLESPIPPRFYGSQREADDLASRENKRLLTEFDDALDRSRGGTIPLDGGPEPAKTVPPSPALPVSNKMAEHASSAMQAVQMSKGAAAAAGPAGAAASAAGAVSGAAHGDPDSLQTLAISGGGIAAALAVGAGFGAYKVARGVVDFATSSAENAEERLAGLSPEVAVAQAQAELRRMRSNMRSAGQIGAEVAAYVRGTSMLDSELQRTRDNLSEPLIEGLGLAKESSSLLLGAVNDNFETLKKLVPALDLLDNRMQAFLDEQKDLNRALKKLLNKPDEEGTGNIFNWFNDHPLELPAPFNGQENAVVAPQFHMPGLGAR